jgi:AraC-like DNA-binding protein
MDWRVWPLADYDLWFFYQGNGKLRDLDGNVREVRPGTCLWMRPGDRYEFWQNEEGPPLGDAYIHFDLFDPDGSPIDKSRLSEIPLVYEAFDFKFFDSVTQQIVSLLRNPPEQNARESRLLQAELLLKSLLIEFETEARTQVKQLQQGIELRHQRKISEITSKIYEDPARIGGMGALARASGYSLDYFSRICKRVTGISPNAILIEARLEKARALLATSDLTIDQISVELGYNNVFYFSRQFKQKTGMSPSHYRKKFH